MSAQTSVVEQVILQFNHGIEVENCVCVRERRTEGEREIGFNLLADLGSEMSTFVSWLAYSYIRWRWILKTLEIQSMSLLKS